MIDEGVEYGLEDAEVRSVLAPGLSVPDETRSGVSATIGLEPTL